MAYCLCRTEKPRPFRGRGVSPHFGLLKKTCSMKAIIQSALWLIEKDMFDESDNTVRMMEIVRAMDMEARHYSYSGYETIIPEDLPAKEECIVAYGSINAAKFINKRCKWVPGVWCDFEILRCCSYLAHWGQFSIQKRYLFLPLAEVYRQKEWLYKTLGYNEHIFIRPDDNMKSFHGEVVAKEKFEYWYEMANFYNPGKSCLCLVSEPSCLSGEWRFVIANRKVISGSQVRCDGNLAVASGFPKEAADFAEQVANSCEFNPHPIYVMDICRSPEGYALMEIGSVNCAGLYACDLKPIVEKASEIARQEWEETLCF